MCGKVIFLSILVCFLAIFVTLEFFVPYRESLKGNIPHGFKSYLHDFVNLFSSYSGFFGNTQYPDKLFSKVELDSYKGSTGGPIYIALLGCVYDVTRGRKHYGPDGGYHGFAGRDATRSFVSGDFTPDGLIEDISDLQVGDMLGLEGWQAFYEKQYTRIGKLTGHFYDSEGNPTEAMNEYLLKLSEAKSEKRKDEDDARLFPPCNSEWRQDSGTRFWCTTLSGGIERDWVGVPRQYFQPGRATPRCACVRTTGPSSSPQGNSKQEKNQGDLDNPKLKLYTNCDPTATSCYLP